MPTIRPVADVTVRVLLLLEADPVVFMAKYMTVPTVGFVTISSDVVIDVAVTPVNDITGFDQYLLLIVVSNRVGKSKYETVGFGVRAYSADKLYVIPFFVSVVVVKFIVLGAVTLVTIMKASHNIRCCRVGCRRWRGASNCVYSNHRECVGRPVC